MGSPRRKSAPTLSELSAKAKLFKSSIAGLIDFKQVEKEYKELIGTLDGLQNVDPKEQPRIQMLKAQLDKDYKNAESLFALQSPEQKAFAEKVTKASDHYSEMEKLYSPMLDQKRQHQKNELTTGLEGLTKSCEKIDNWSKETTFTFGDNAKSRKQAGKDFAASLKPKLDSLHDSLRSIDEKNIHSQLDSINRLFGDPSIDIIIRSNEGKLPGFLTQVRDQLNTTKNHFVEDQKAIKELEEKIEPARQEKEKLLGQSKTGRVALDVELESKVTVSFLTENKDSGLRM